MTDENSVESIAASSQLLATPGKRSGIDSGHRFAGAGNPITDGKGGG